MPSSSLAPSPRSLLTLLGLAALLAGAERPAAAQVGHAPESSPYRDIRFGSYLVATGGKAYGSGGAAGLGPHDGSSYGFRFVLLGNKPFQISLGGTYGNLSRLLQNPHEAPATRTSGPFDQRVLFADVAFQLNLTGNKSWRGIAPYVGAGGGLLFAEAIPEDTTSFRMGTRFYFAPFFGSRLFVGQRIYLFGEMRATFWQIRYPASYGSAPSNAPGEPPVITGGPSEWTVTPWLQAGLGWAWSLPF